MADTITLAIDALTSAAFIEGGVSIERTEEARERTEQRKRELIEAIAACQPQAVEAQAPAAVAVPPSAYVNAAGITASDKPGTVVRKLDAAFHDAVTFKDATPALPSTEDSSAGDLAEVVPWDGKLSDQLQRAINDLHIECKPAVVRHLDFAIRSEITALHTSLATVKRMYAAARDRLEAIDAAQPDPFASNSQAEVQAEPVALQMCSDLKPRTESEKAAYLAGVADGRMYAERDADTAPQAQPADAPIAYLQEADQHLLHRFIETTEDDESFDIGKDAVKRLANLGVVESCGFGRYGVTMFGYWVHENFWHQNPSLPLKTNADRDREHRAAMAAARPRAPRPPADQGLPLLQEGQENGCGTCTIDAAMAAAQEGGQSS